MTWGERVGEGLGVWRLGVRVPWYYPRGAQNPNHSGAGRVDLDITSRHPCHLVLDTVASEVWFTILQTLLLHLSSQGLRFLWAPG